MRDKLSTTEVINAITSVLQASSSTARTAIGCSVDTNGFKELLAILSVGQVRGTGGGTADVYVTIEEAATQGATDTSWSAINDGQVVGTAVSTYLAIVATTGAGAMADTGNYVTKLYTRLNDGTRSRYIRPKVSAVGSAALVQFSFAVDFVMSRAADTGLYILNALVASTGNSEYSSWPLLTDTGFPG